MSKLKTLGIASIASVAAFGLSAASAAVMVTGPEGESGGVPAVAPTLDVGSPVNIDNNDISDMDELNDVGSFMVADGIIGGDTAVDVRFGNGLRAGIMNLAITFFVEGMDAQTFNITDAAGVDIDGNTSFLVDLTPGTMVDFVVTGTVFEDFGQEANYNINILAQAVPVPAAGLLFGTALVGGAIARRKRKLA